LLNRNAITEIVLCVGYLGEIIEKRYGDGDTFGVRIKYSFDGPQLLGTGGAIRKASAYLSAPFFVLYGDSYLPIDYQDAATAFNEAGKTALMTVFENSNAWDTSNVWFDDAKTRL
jgi:NDP-sugar pyrophosphorylase family protein